jgi:hypothetical protein
MLGAMASMSRIRRVSGALVTLMVVCGGLGASDADLHTSLAGQAVVHPGDAVRYLCGYANAGPDEATTAYVDVHVPAGMPAALTDLTQQQIDELEASAQGTDTLGNTPMLFFESNYCESLLFQLQGPSPPGAIEGLGPGVAASFSFELPIPMEKPRLARLKITRPASLATEYLPGHTRTQLYLNDGDTRRYGMGGNCGQYASGCSVLGDCFGARVSLMEPLLSELQLVDDGGVAGDPSLGCGKPVGFTAGRIAVVRRGECQFVEKALFAQEVQASALLVVNDGRCAGLGPDSDDCVINMDGTPIAGEVDIPVVLLSYNDGEPIIAELEAGTPVRAAIGAMARESFELSSTAFHVDPGDSDPDPANDDDSLPVRIGLFADGFESGDLSEWSSGRGSAVVEQHAVQGVLEVGDGP